MAALDAATRASRALAQYVGQPMSTMPVATGAADLPLASSQRAGPSATSDTPTVLAEEDSNAEGPLSSLGELLGGLLDKVGVTCHRRELTSQSYQMLRHCLYSSLLTMAMLIGILTHCYLWEGNPSCGTLLKAWAIFSCTGFFHLGVYTNLGLLHTLLRRYGQLGSRPPLWCVGLHHVASAVLTAIGVLLSLHIVMIYSLHKLKAFVVVVIVCNAVACIRCSKYYVVRLIQLEIMARALERRAFRERLANNVLTIAMFLEVPRVPNVELQAPGVLEEQPVCPFDPSVFEETPECCICSREFDSSGEIRKTRCGHVFHAACLGGWLRRSLTCPLCREELAANLPPQPQPWPPSLPLSPQSLPALSRASALPSLPESQAQAQPLPSSRQLPLLPQPRSIQPQPLSLQPHPQPQPLQPHPQPQSFQPQPPQPHYGPAVPVGLEHNTQPPVGFGQPPLQDVPYHAPAAWALHRPPTLTLSPQSLPYLSRASALPSSPASQSQEHSMQPRVGFGPPPLQDVPYNAPAAWALHRHQPQPSHRVQQPRDVELVQVVGQTRI